MAAETDRALVSAVVIPVPIAVAAFARAYREAYSEVDFYPVMPHITIMWPFVSPGTAASGPDPEVLRATADKLREVCRLFPPFMVTLDHYGTFPGVLYLAPRDPAPILALHRRILAAFPDYLPYEGQFGGLNPHMTLGMFETAETLNAAPRPDFDPFTFLVEKVCFMYGDPGRRQPWETAAVIPLGGEDE